MIVAVARFIVILSGVWLVAISLFMIYRPGRALNLLSKMASTNFINYTEITLRMLVGIAFVIVAYEWRMHFVFTFFGWFLVVSAGVLYAIPRTWHHNYALYWSRKLTPFYVQASAPFSLGVGILIVKTMI